MDTKLSAWRRRTRRRRREKSDVGRNSWNAGRLGRREMGKSQILTYFLTACLIKLC